MIVEVCAGAPQIAARPVAKWEFGKRWKRWGERACKAAQLFETRDFPVKCITAHRFVGALAGEHHGDVISSKLGNEIEWNTARISHRFIQMPDHQRQGISEITS